MITQSSDSALYELGKLQSADLSSLKTFFDQLPPDPYADNRLRSRRYSRLKFKEGKLFLRSHKQFMQEKDINEYLGDVLREYEEVDDLLLENETFTKMCQEFLDRTDLSEKDVIEVHQIRFHCRKNAKAPAPEGVHQDGFDYIGIYVVESDNHKGGEVLLFENKTDDPFFSKAFEPGEFVVLNDKKLFHNAAPLIPTENNEDGHWDIFVLTANRTA